MPLSTQDWEAIRNGTAHTPEAPKGCSAFIQMTKDQLTTHLQKPRTREAIYQETLNICRMVAQLIEGDASINEIYQVFYKLVTTKEAFTRIRDLVRSARREAFSINDWVLIHAYSKEWDLLGNITGLPQYMWNWNASIHNLNWIIYTTILRYGGIDTGESKQAYADIGAYMLKIVNIISSVIDGQTFSLIDTNHFHELGMWMNRFFSNNKKRSYTYNVNADFDTPEVPTAIMDAILMIMPLHVPGQNVQIQITHENEYIQVSATLEQKHSNIENPKSLPSYVWCLDGAPFLQWMIDIFPEFIRFYVSDDRTIFWFRIKTKNPS